MYMFEGVDVEIYRVSVLVLTYNGGVCISCASIKQHRLLKYHMYGGLCVVVGRDKVDGNEPSSLERSMFVCSFGLALFVVSLRVWHLCCWQAGVEYRITGTGAASSVM